MAKTLIDVDAEQLAAAQKVLNTQTKKDTGELELGHAPGRDQPGPGQRA
jgi:Arc/MetJ family transcription regulator